MIRPAMVWGLARAEARLTRRLVRYWLFVIVGGLLAAGQFANFAFIYKFFSFGSGSAATINPRYFLANAAGAFLMIFYVGLIFLAYEVRARDQRERIVEVLDARPISNLELLAGRALGIALISWIPLAVVVGLISLVGVLIKTPIHGLSIVTMLVFFTVPSFAYMIGVIFLFTLLVKNRLVAFLVSVLFIVASFVGFMFMPLWTSPIMDTMGGNTVLFPSDLVPEVINGAGVVQRTGFLLIGLGLIVLAAVLHPRKDGAARGRQAAVAVGMLVAGFGLVTWLALGTKSNVDRQIAWESVHRERLGAIVPDLRAVRGDVRVVPGKKLGLDIELELAGTDQNPSTALFAFNPGMEISEVSSDLGPLTFTHEDGLLEVDLGTTLAPGTTATVSLVAEGEPDPWFAYIDAVKNPYLQKNKDAQIVFLGYKPMIWDKRYVALMPGVRWLPTPGPDVDRGGDLNPIDYFEIDLTFEVPGGWLAAGPGRREEVGREGDTVRYRYAPDAPLPEVCLIASEFESVSTDIEGVIVEALVHPSHMSNIEFFTDAAGEIRETLTERLAEAAEAGLDYPYGALTLVEVPIPLRGYGGGWRMDTTLTQPAMILSRENTFPTAWFEGGKRQYERAKDREGGVPRAKREILEAFFENDFNGGNPFPAAARSFLGYQTSGFGPEAVPMDYVLEQLTSKTVADKRGFFSVHFFSGDFGRDFQEAGQSMRSENRISDSYADILIDRLTSTNEVWDTISRVKLTEVDPRQEPEETLNALALKGGAMADSMLDGMGKKQAGRFLAALREQSSGKAYTRDDIVFAGNEVGEDLETWLDLWMDQTALPGFWAEETRYFRLTDDDTGAPRYQLLVTLRNGEAPAGLVRLEYRTEDGAGGRLRTEPITVPGNGSVEIGLVLSEPLEWLRLMPYLALNRRPFNLSIPPIDSERLVEQEPFHGDRVVELDEEDDGSILVDDLDEAFTVESDAEGGSLRASGSKDDVDLDGGLPPVTRARPGAEWGRYVHPETYGKYRHTMAVVRKGKGSKRAVFSAEIPKSGRWTLSFFLPSEQRSGLMRAGKDRGTWKLVIDDGTGTHEIDFEAETSDSGWNSLGEFDIASGTVRVIVTDETEGEYVVADAIRWTPGERNEEQVAEAK